MDPLSELFSSMKIKKTLSTRVEATAPWGIQSTGGHEIKFVLVLNGSGILKTSNQEKPIALSSGDVFILLDDTHFTIVDHPKSKILACEEVEKLRKDNRIDFGGGGAPTTFLSGYFELDPLDAKPLLAALPKFMHIRLDQSRTHSFQSILELLASETERASLASDAIINRLYELLFIHSIRIFTSNCDSGCGGWLAAIADKQLGETIQMMHAELERDWTVQTLATKAGMSRSAFAAKFKAIVGQTPLEYLTHWRIYKAGILIRKQNLSLSEVSQRVGYESESAFNRVFKKEMGMTPGTFRKSINSNLS